MYALLRKKQGDKFSEILFQNEYCISVALNDPNCFVSLSGWSHKGPNQQCRDHFFLLKISQRRHVTFGTCSLVTRDTGSLHHKGGGEVLSQVSDQLLAGARAVGELQLLQLPQLDEVREAAGGELSTA